MKPPTNWCWAIYSVITVLSILPDCVIARNRGNVQRKTRQELDTAPVADANGGHGEGVGTNYGVYQPIINIEVPKGNTACDEDKISLDELKERFTIQEAKLERILDMLSQQLCPCTGDPADVSSSYDEFNMEPFSSSSGISDVVVDFSSSSSYDYSSSDWDSKSIEVFSNDTANNTDSSTEQPSATDALADTVEIIVNNNTLVLDEGNSSLIADIIDGQYVTRSISGDTSTATVEFATTNKASLETTTEDMVTSSSNMTTTDMTSASTDTNLDSSSPVSGIGTSGNFSDAFVNESNHSNSNISDETVESYYAEQIEAYSSSSSSSTASSEGSYSWNENDMVYPAPDGLPLNETTLSVDTDNNITESSSSGTMTPTSNISPNYLYEDIQTTTDSSLTISSPNISTSNISSTNISSSDFSSSNVSNANISNDNVSNADIFNANDSISNFSNSNISTVNSSNPNIYSTNVSNSNISSSNASFPNGTNQNNDSAELGPDYEESYYYSDYYYSEYYDSQYYDEENTYNQSSSNNSSLVHNTTSSIPNVNGTDDGITRNSSHAMDMLQSYQNSIDDEGVLNSTLSNGTLDSSENFATNTSSQEVTAPTEITDVSQQDTDDEERNVAADDANAEPSSSSSEVLPGSRENEYSSFPIDDGGVASFSSSLPESDYGSSPFDDREYNDKDSRGDYEDGTCPPASKLRSSPPKDCDDVGASSRDDYGAKKSGEYCVYPTDAQRSIRVFCDFDNDGGGWTVIQRHETDADFHRTWDEYRDGFGDISADFWLGNDNIHRLTTQDVYVMRIDISDYLGHSAYAEYDSFSIGDEDLFYQLVVGKYSGNAGDSLRWHNHHAFSTMDADHDTYHGSCADVYRGGWWYTSCLSSNLNGDQLPPGSREMGIVWTKFQKGANLKSATMKIRRAHFPRTSRDSIRREDISGRRVEGGEARTYALTAVEGKKDAEDEDDVAGIEEMEVVDMRPKMKKNKLNKIFKNFYNKWKRR